MTRILIFTVIFSTLSFGAFGQTIRMFYQDIEIPSKYKLDAIYSLDRKQSQIIFRGSGWSNFSEDGEYGVVTIGKVSDYISNGGKTRLSELGTIVRKTVRFSELKVPNHTDKLSDGKIYYTRVYFNNIYYIEYFTTDLNDIDKKFTGK